MFFQIYFDRDQQSFSIEPASHLVGSATKEDIERLLDTELFLPVKNSMTFVRGKLVGQTDNILHLECLSAFINRNSVPGKVDTQNTVDKYMRELPSHSSTRHPVVYFELSLNLEGLILQSRKDARPYKLFVLPYDDLEMLLRKTNLDPNILLKSTYAQFVTVHQADDGISVKIKADFHNISHVSAVRDFLKTHVLTNDDCAMVRDNVNEAVRELAARYLHLCQINRQATKSDFTDNLNRAELNEWPALFDAALAVKKIYIPGLSDEGTSFAWIASSDFEYASRVASIVTNYDTKKGFGRTMLWNHPAIRALSGSQNKSAQVRKAILTDFFAALIYDTKWAPSAAAEKQLSASASAIVSANKRKM